MKTQTKQEYRGFVLQTSGSDKGTWRLRTFEASADLIGSHDCDWHTYSLMGASFSRKGYATPQDAIDHYYTGAKEALRL